MTKFRNLEPFFCQLLWSYILSDGTKTYEFSASLYVFECYYLSSIVILSNYKLGISEKLIKKWSLIIHLMKRSKKKIFDNYLKDSECSSILLNLTFWTSFGYIHWILDI